MQKYLCSRFGVWNKHSTETLHGTNTAHWRIWISKKNLEENFLQKTISLFKKIQLWCWICSFKPIVPHFMKVFVFVSYIIFYVFCGLRDWTQDFTHAREALYHMMSSALLTLSSYDSCIRAIVLRTKFRLNVLIPPSLKRGALRHMTAQECPLLSSNISRGLQRKWRDRSLESRTWKLSFRNTLCSCVTL